MKCPYAIRICTKCKRLLVANEINFAKSKRGKWGLQPKCKICNKKYRNDNASHYKKYNKEYREVHAEELSEKARCIEKITKRG